MKNPLLKKRAGRLAAVLAVLAVAYAAFSTYRNRTGPHHPSIQAQAAVEANTAFALDFYREVKAQPGNLFFSPYSLSTVAAMAYSGARGTTESEIAGALHFQLPQEELHVAFGELNRRLMALNRRKGVTLTSANSVWCQRDHPLTRPFVKSLKANYAAEARQVDFVNASGAAADQINDWVNDKTKGRIQELTVPGAIDAQSVLVLCNAVYFKGRWEMEFDPARTGPEPFSISSNRTVTVPMMRQFDFFKLTVTTNAALIALPYLGNHVSMVIVLPHELEGLSRVEEEFTPDNLKVWLSALDQAQPRTVEVLLPRFTFETSVDLAPRLKSMGVRSLFESGVADLSGMDGSRKLFVSDAIHRAFVEVNEEGTEAAAATGMVAATAADEPLRFAAGHPFIFLIRDNGSGSILFLGRVADPTLRETWL